MRTASGFPVGKMKIGGVVEGIRLMNKVYPEPRVREWGWERVFRAYK